MDQRLKLHRVLVDLFGPKNVYFQPTKNLKMQYPCVVYSTAGSLKKSADNLPYKRDVEYKVTVIDRDPDGELWTLVDLLPKTKLDRVYVADNLNHHVFTIYS